jgi:hypothetical protein
MEINPILASNIRYALKKLDDMGADHYADFWLTELHQVNGYPINDRWNAMTLRQIENDVTLIAGQSGEINT